MVRRLTPLPDFEETHARDLNDNGIAVGHSRRTHGGIRSRATVWYPDGRVEGFDEVSAEFVNNQNLIVTRGYRTGAEHRVWQNGVEVVNLSAAIPGLDSVGGLNNNGQVVFETGNRIGVWDIGQGRQLASTDLGRAFIMLGMDDAGRFAYLINASNDENVLDQYELRHLRAGEDRSTLIRRGNLAMRGWLARGSMMTVNAPPDREVRDLNSSFVRTIDPPGTGQGRPVFAEYGKVVGRAYPSKGASVRPFIEDLSTGATEWIWDDNTPQGRREYGSAHRINSRGEVLTIGTEDWDTGLENSCFIVEPSDRRSVTGPTPEGFSEALRLISILFGGSLGPGGGLLGGDLKPDGWSSLSAVTRDTIRTLAAGSIAERIESSSVRQAMQRAHVEALEITVRELKERLHRG